LSEATVESLLQGGADQSLTDANGKTALQVDDAELTPQDPQVRERITKLLSR